MRLISYNVRYFGHGLKGLASTNASARAIAQSISRLSPLADVIALQEVEARSIRANAAVRGSHRAETQLEGFIRHLEAALVERGHRSTYQPFYYPAHVYRLGPVKLYTTGLALLVNANTFHVIGGAHQPITHHASMRLKTVKQTRIAAHLHLEGLKGERVHLFNTHLSLPTPWAQEFWSQKTKMGFGRNQLAEALSVSTYAEQIAKHEPYVLMGDFNSSPVSPVYQALTKDVGLIGAQESLGLIDCKRANEFPTAGFMRLRMHLDHIFLSRQGVRAVDMNGTHAFGDRTSPFHGLSDHVPLIANLELGR